jgi:subtilisin family serine protease
MITSSMQPEVRRKYLDRQIEQIRDLAEDRVVEVVIKVRSDEDNADAFLDTVAEALKRRGLSTRSRDLLPADHQSLKKGLRSKASREVLKQHGESISAQMTGAGLLRANQIESRASAALQNFLDSDSVKESVAAVSAVPAKDRPEPREPIVFWTSSSAVLQIRDEDLQKLSERPDIESIYLNQRLFAPPVLVPKSVPDAVLDNKVSSWGLRMIGALSVWGAFGCRGEDVTVGLLDTGVDPAHPDLEGKIAGWAEFDSMGRPVESEPHDSDQHGTHCAGIIAGGNASGRWIGVAPQAKIAAALVLNGAQGGTHAQILAGIEWAIDREVDVISMSLGGLIMTPDVPSTYTRAILSAVKRGIPVVTAIGNEGSQTTGSPANDFLAFAVGATDHEDRAAGFSGGRTQVIRESPVFPPQTLPLIYSKPDLSAPGVAVYSSVPGGSWEHMNGTSMAAPHVAGAIALLLSGTKISSEVPVRQRAFLIQDLLTGSAKELGEAGQNHRFGFGRVDALSAIGFARDLGY